MPENYASIKRRPQMLTMADLLNSEIDHAPGELNHIPVAFDHSGWLTRAM